MLRRAEFVGIDLLKEIYMTASKLQHTQFQSRAWKCHQERFRNIIFDIFTHGLKWLTRKKSFWGLVEEVTHSGVVNDIKRHSGSSDYKHWCMIWVMQVIDEGTLSCYLMSMNEAMLAKFYNSDALLRDSHFFSNLLTVTQDLDQNTHDKREKHNNRSDTESHDECLPSMDFPDSYDPFEENFTKRRSQEEVAFSLPDKINARHMSNAYCEPAKTGSAPYHFDTYKNTYLNDESIQPSLTIGNRKSSTSLSQNSKNSQMPNSKNEGFLSHSSLSKVCDYNPLNAMFKLNGKTCRSFSTGEMSSEAKKEKRRNSDGSTIRSQFEELLRYSLGLGSAYPKYIDDSSSSSSLSDLSEVTKISESPQRSTITDTALSMLGMNSHQNSYVNKSSENTPNVYRPANYLGSISSPDMSCHDKILAASVGSTSDNAITKHWMKETNNLKGILKRPSTEKISTANLSLLSGNGLIPIDPTPPATKEVCSAIRGLNSLPCKTSSIPRVFSMVESRPNHVSKSLSSSSSSSSSSLKTPIVTLNPVDDNEVVTPRQIGRRHGNKNNRKSWPSYQGPPLDICDISEEMSDLSLLKSSLMGRDRNLVKLVQRKRRSHSFDKNSIFEDVDGVEPGRNIMGSNRLSSYSFNSSGSFVSVGSPSNESYNSMFTSLESFVSACDASTKTAPVNGSTSAESFTTVNDSSTEIVSVNGSTSAESFMTVGDTISEYPSLAPIKNSPAESHQILQDYRHKNQQMQKSLLTLTSPFPQPFSSSSSSPSSPLLSYEDNQAKGHLNVCTDSSLSVNVDCGSEDDASIPSDVTTPRQSYIEDSDQVSLSSCSTSDGSQLTGECPFIFNCNISRAVKLTLSSTCPTCHCSLVAEFNPRMPRKCSYDGQYYCDRDHINDTFYIPAEMVFNWKFERFKVSRRNYEFLTSWFDQPVIDMNALCARLHYYVTPLHNVRDQRQYLFYLHGILNVCTSVDAENILSQWPSSYVYENEDLYSMHDLVKVDSGEMYSYLDNCISISSKHIRKCGICKMEGTVCKMCNAEPVLLTYDRNAAVCSRCGDLVHKSCLPFSGVCTICEIPRGTPEDINKHCVVM